MRIIDADDLKDWSEIVSLTGDGGIDINDFDEKLESMPTVDAVPARHGKWIHEVRYTIDSLHSYQQYRCSECDMTYITNTKYCPNCGARMVEDE